MESNKYQSTPKEMEKNPWFDGLNESNIFLENKPNILKNPSGKVLSKYLIRHAKVHQACYEILTKYHY
jgi:hypothetical protein